VVSRPELKALTMDSPPEKRCHLCGREDELRFCGLCKKYFCPECERKYRARAAAAILEGYAAVLSAGRALYSAAAKPVAGGKKPA
jgi:hypothetical protein